MNRRHQKTRMNSSINFMHVNEGENKLRKMTVLFLKGYKNDNTRCLSIPKTT